MTVVATRRRINLLQAWKRCGGGWVMLTELELSGAYGSRTAIHTAMRRLREQDVVEIDKSNGDWRYRFTGQGIVALGMVPTKADRMEPKS